jgi:hypothetical protein
MNILDCFCCCYRLFYPLRRNQTRKQIYDTKLQGYIQVSRADTVVLRTGNSPIKTYIQIAGIKTPQINIQNDNERAAAIYVLKRLNYQFSGKLAVVENFVNGKGDVICGDITLKKWLIMNRLAVPDNEPVPDNWLHYIEQRTKAKNQGSAFSTQP